MSRKRENKMILAYGILKFLKNQVNKSVGTCISWCIANAINMKDIVDVKVLVGWKYSKQFQNFFVHFLIMIAKFMYAIFMDL